MDPLDFLAQVESNARTYANTFPRMFTSGKGVKVTDSEGREYIDCLSNAGTLALGHNHPEVKQAIGRYLDSDQLQQALDLGTPAKYDFVQAIFSLLPRELRDHGKIHFCGPTGADAVEAAIKLAKHYSGRANIMAFQGGYHGMTAGALAAMGNLQPKNHLALSGVHFLPYPYAFRCPFGTDGTHTDQLSIDYIHNVLSDPESGVVKPAAMIIEVVQGEGGCIPASVHWLREVRNITREHDIALIVDEVQTGFGRTGRMFAFEHAGITPDILVLSKAIGGGHPMSVIVYHEKYNSWQPGMHTGTFRGNQIAMVAGGATMRIVKRDDLAGKAEEKGRLLVAGLRSVAGRFPFLADIRGRGLMIGVEVAATDSGRRRDPSDGALAKLIKKLCFDRGLILETGGRYGAVLRFLPPLIISDTEIREVLERFEAAVEDAYAIWVAADVIERSPSIAEVI